MEKKATALKKDRPDEAIALLQESIRIQSPLNMAPSILLDLRLRIATVLYENKRFDEAEQSLMREFDSRKHPFLKFNTSIAQPDFERNLYFLRIYEKMTTLYTRRKDFISAAIFQTLRQYSELENSTHNEYSGWQDQPPTQSFEKMFSMEKVDALLNKAGKIMMSGAILKLVKLHFLSKPSQDRCWKLYEDLQSILGK